MHTLHKIPAMQVLVVGEVVEWDAPGGVRLGTVRAVGDSWTDVDGYVFSGDARARLKRPTGLDESSAI